MPVILMCGFQELWYLVLDDTDAVSTRLFDVSQVLTLGMVRQSERFSHVSQGAATVPGHLCLC